MHSSCSLCTQKPVRHASARDVCSTIVSWLPYPSCCGKEEHKHVGLYTPDRIGCLSILHMQMASFDVLGPAAGRQSPELQLIHQTTTMRHELDCDFPSAKVLLGPLAGPLCCAEGLCVMSSRSALRLGGFPARGEALGLPAASVYTIQQHTTQAWGRRSCQQYN